MLPRASDNNIVLGPRLLKRGGSRKKNHSCNSTRTFITGEWILGVPPGTYYMQPQLAGNVVTKCTQAVVQSVRNGSLDCQDQYNSILFVAVLFCPE